MTDQLLGELIQPARVVGRRRHHVQRLHADHADEGLHGVVGEDAAAAADAGAGMAGDVVAILGVGMAGDLVGGHEVDRLARLGVGAGMDRSIRHDDGGPIVLEQRGQRADRRLVAGDDGDGAGKPGGAEMLAQRIVRDLAADQRVAHLARAVADAVGRGDRVLGLDQPELELALSRADAALELVMDGVDLRHDAEVALAVALGADDADRRLVDQVGIGAEARATPIDCELRPGWRSMRTVREVMAKALGVVRLRSGRENAPAGRDLQPVMTAGQADRCPPAAVARKGNSSPSHSPTYPL